MKVEIENTTETKTTYEYFHVLKTPFHYTDDYDVKQTMEGRIKTTRTPVKYTHYVTYAGVIPGAKVKLIEKKKTVDTVIEMKEVE